MTHRDRVRGSSGRREAAGDASRFVSGRAEVGGVALGVEIANSLPLILADSRKVKQIDVNLLSNAFKFTPNGRHVTIEARIAAGQSVHMAVIDTGIGMAAGDIAKAMAPFLQIDGALNRKFEGTGLGLPAHQGIGGAAWWQAGPE